jgi:transposase
MNVGGGCQCRSKTRPVKRQPGVVAWRSKTRPLDRLIPQRFGGCLRMYGVENYAAVRQFVFIEGKSRREAARFFGLSRDTIARMCRFSVPPGYTWTKPPRKPKLGPLLPVIDAILAADMLAPHKKKHTAKRIFERLRDEHGYSRGYTAVKGYVKIAKGLAQLAVLAFERLEAFALIRRGARLGAAIAFGLLHPIGQRLRRATDLGRNRGDRRPLR